MFDYKKIIKSRKVRHKLLRMIGFIPDSFMIKLQYYIKVNRILNLNNPIRYTEKLQWYKLFYRNSLMPICVDKYLVRGYVKSNGYADILNKLIGCYESVNDIDYDELPKRFVLKDTLGSGGNSVIICKNKDSFKWGIAKEKAQSWLDDYGGKHPGREWVYENGKNRLLIEEYIDSDEKCGLIDYKFFCFNGRCEYVYGICDRKFGEKAKLGIYDREFTLLPYRRMDEEKMDIVLRKPDNYYQMRECAETLAKNFPHVRVDLYNINGKIIFGEMTFFDGSGYMEYEPDEFDFILGNKFVLPM